MANWVTSSYGLVTREASTTSEEILPSLTVSADPWINVTALNPRPVIGDHYDGTNFTLDATALTEAQATKLATFRDLCAQHILNGFYRGNQLPDDTQAYAYWYPGDKNSQGNICDAGASAMMLMPNYPNEHLPLWCGRGETVAAVTDWLIREHTLDQIMFVANAQREHIAAAQWEMRDRVTEILACATVGAVDAITWQTPPL